MFLFGTKLYKSSKLILAIKPVHSYGLYRRKFLLSLFKYHSKTLVETFTPSSIALLKYYLNVVLVNIEMDATLTHINIQLKKTLQTYQGLRLQLDLPVRGQWTRTNASTQRMLAYIPRRRHFVQKKNWRKFAPKDQKRPYIKNKTYENKNPK